MYGKQMKETVAREVRFCHQANIDAFLEEK